MYGMIHKAIREMVVDAGDRSDWDILEYRHGFGPATLVSARVYDDETTVAMLQAAADQMGLDLPQTMERLGERWIAFAQSGAYGEMMDFAGRDFVGFLGNLDTLHQAIGVGMPAAKVPSFRVAAHSAAGVALEYRSVRTGLEPFVVGLLRGLMARFGLNGSIRHGERQGDMVPFDIVFAGDGPA